MSCLFFINKLSLSFSPDRLKGKAKACSLAPPQQVNQSVIQSLLQKFHNNNFGITDSLLQCIGAGVYPSVALLNVRLLLC